MLLRNKKTGEIVEVESLYLTQTQELYLNYTNKENKQKVYMTDKIASFNLEWEDYEENNYYWYIDDMGMPSICSKHHDKTAKRKAFGNYFETKEEAEKVVEKLKAWKRLKDKGFKFKNDFLDICCHTINFKVDRQFDMTDETSRDLHLLFGGEE